MRRAAKRDDNEALIVTALQSAGWTVVRVSDTGVPDLLCAKDGKVTLLEVKAVDGTLTKAQEETFTRLATAGVLVQVVRSPQEALDVVGATQDPYNPFNPATKRRWYSVSGAFICESCWLPEDGLHAKDCPQRTKLKPKPAVQSAHRAATKAEEAMPKTYVRVFDPGGPARHQTRFSPPLPWRGGRTPAAEGEAMTEQDKRLVDNAIPEVLAEHFGLLTAVCDREKDPIRKLIWLGLAKQAQAVAESAVQQFKSRANG